MMTKVQIHFQLQRPLDDALLSRISDAHSLYGIQHVKLNSKLDGVTVEFDASRLRAAEVEAALTGAGIPVEAVGVPAR
jgi:hypothetical protein